MWRWECNTVGFFSCVSWCWIVHGLSFEKQPTRWVNAETTQWSEISNWFWNYWGMGLRSHSVTIGQKPKLIWSFEPGFMSYMLSQWMLMLAVVQITSLIFSRSLGSVPRQSAKYFYSLYCPFSFTTLTIPFSTWIEFHLSPFLFLACFFIYICNSRLSDENPAKVSMITCTLLPLSLSFLLGFWASMVAEFHALVLEVFNVWLAGSREVKRQMFKPRCSTYNEKSKSSSHLCQQFEPLTLVPLMRFYQLSQQTNFYNFES